MEVSFLAGRAGGEFTRCLVRAGFEVDVAFAAFAALAEHKPAADLGEVRDELVACVQLARFLVLFLNDAADERSGRDFEDVILRAAAGALFAAAFLTVRGDELAVVEEIAQGVGAGIDLEDDAAATAAIAAVRAAFGTEFATVKVHGAIAAFAGAGVNLDLVDEHGGWGEAKLCRMSI